MAALSSILLAATIASAGAGGVLGIDGHTHFPLKDSHGKPVAFIFISHDCPICNSYAPEFQRIDNRFGKRVDIDMVYEDPDLTRAGAQAHARAFGLAKMGLFIDPHGTFAEFCKATVTPQAIVFDANGASVYSGRIDDRYPTLGVQKPQASTHDFSDALDAVIAHKTPKKPAGEPVGCFIVLPKT